MKGYTKLSCVRVKLEKCIINESNAVQYTPTNILKIQKEEKSGLPFRCTYTIHSFIKSRIAAALVDSDATEEEKKEATARYLPNG